MIVADFRIKKTGHECLFTNVIDGKRFEAKRVLNEFDMFLRYNEALSIIHRLNLKQTESLTEIVSQYMPFGLRSYERGTTKPTSNDDLVLYSSKGTGYVKRATITESLEYIDTYNVITGKAISGHLGETDENGQVKLLATTQIIKPGEICTESYLAIGCCNSLSEVRNLYKYVVSKFARFLLLQGLTSMNITKDRFLFVPLQDFTPQSDIDWSKSIAEIDRQLYDKYNLTEAERNFIEKMIKPME